MDNSLLKAAASALAILGVASIGLRTIALDGLPDAGDSRATPALVTQGGQVSYHIPKETAELRLSANRDGASAVLMLRFNAGKVQAIQTENNGLVAQIRGAPAPGADVQVLVTDMEGNPLDGVQVVPDLVLSAPASTSTPVPPPTATPAPAATPKPTRTPAPTHTAAPARATKDAHAEDREAHDDADDDNHRGHGRGGDDDYRGHGKADDDEDDDNSGPGGGGHGGKG